MSEAKDNETYYLVKLIPISAPPEDKRRLNQYLYELPYYLSVSSDFWWRLRDEGMSDYLTPTVRHGILAACIQYVNRFDKATRFANLEDAQGCADLFSARLRAHEGDHRHIHFQAIEVIRFDPITISKVQL